MDSALALIAQSSLKQGLPTFKVGQTVRVHQKIKEGGKERVQVFEGLIIQTNKGTGISGTVTIRKIVDGIGVERIYSIHSPNIAKIEITKEARVRRSKLYYMRDLTGKSARMRTTILEGQVFEPKSAAQIQAEKDAVEAEKQAQKDAAEAKKAAEKVQDAASEKEVQNDAPADESGKDENNAVEAEKKSE